MVGYLERHATSLAREVLDAFPITVIEGARQVGKSTFAEHLAAGSAARIVTLDDEGMRVAAEEDPVTFVAQHDGLLVIDEVQRVPGLLLALKAAVDRDRRPGRFLITGSSDLLRHPGAPESLAGRAVTVRLDALSQGERAARPDAFAARVAASSRLPGDFTTALDRADYVARIVAGGYPEPSSLSPRMRDVWIDAYVDRLISRDARDLTRVPDPGRLAALVRLLAANQSGELVKSRLARDAGIPETSVSALLGLLDALFLTDALRPWTPNLTSREIGRPKAFIADSGIAVRSARLREAALIRPDGSGHLGGQLEGFVVGELRKQSRWTSDPHELFHYRDRDGLEVDVVIEFDDGRVLAVEVKASATVKHEHFKGIRALRQRLGDRFVAGVVLNTARSAVQYGDRLIALPVAALWEL